MERLDTGTLIRLLNEGKTVYLQDGYGSHSVTKSSVPGFALVDDTETSFTTIESWFGKFIYGRWEFWGEVAQ